MFLFKLSLILIFFLIPKILLASQWIEGNKLVIQGLDKITARIESFEVKILIFDIIVSLFGFVGKAEFTCYQHRTILLFLQLLDEKRVFDNI